MYYTDIVPLELALEISKAFPKKRFAARALSFGEAFSTFMETGIYPEVFFSGHIQKWVWSVNGAEPKNGCSWNDAAAKALSAALGRHSALHSGNTIF